VATSPIRALVIGEREFRRLLDRSPSILVKVMEALADRIAPTTI
jgi:CRP-like cAMP-binding protein